jgi:hypothetical protein
MTIYEKQNNVGESWFRDVNGNKVNGIVALSAFSLKYSTISEQVYTDINTNQIVGLNTIQDVILIETPNCFIIDKFELLDGLPVPSNNYNNSYIFPTNYKAEYWYMESERKIYTFFGGLSASDTYAIKIYEFDILKNEYKNRADLIVTFTGGMYVENVDRFKVCYNKDTKLFNLSCLIYDDANSLSLVSINIKKKEVYELVSVNVVLDKEKYSEFVTESGEIIIDNFGNVILLNNY